LASLFAVLFAVASLAQGGVATAQTTTGQATSPQTAGTATISFSDAWEYDSDISDTDTAFLSHTTIANTLYIYGEIVDATVTDPETAIDQFATGFFGAFGDGNEQIVDSDTIDTDTVWRLYSVDQSGVPYGMLVTANVALVPGTVVVNVLLSPEGSFDLAVAATQSDVDVNGAGSPLASFNGEELSATLESGGTSTGTTATAAAGTPTQTTGGLTLPPLTTPTVAAGGETPTQTTGGLTLPPLNQTPTQATGAVTPTAAAGTTGQTVMVNAATISYGGNWTYEEARSTPDQIAFFSNTTSETSIFGYAAVADTSGDVTVGLQNFNDGFFGSFGATNVQQLTMETLPSGKAYSLYTAEQGTTPVAVLAYADTTTAPGEFRVQLLIVATSDFDAMLSDVRQAFQVDGAGAFSELDPAALSTLLGGGGTTTTPVQTTPTQTTGGLTLPPLNQTPTQTTGTTGTTPTPATTGTTPTPATTGQVQSVIVNGANVTYGPIWVYEAETSTPDQLAFFSHGTSQTALFGYASINDVTATDASAALQQFNDGFFGSFTATNVQQVSMETLPSGLAYSLYTADRSGVPVVILMYADVTTVPGQFRVQIMMSESSEFSTIFTDTRQSVQVDGVPAFNELDPATLTTLLGS
jgi:hypothetical protein